MEEDAQPLPQCPRCGPKGHVVNYGKRKAKNRTAQRYKCMSCDRTFSTEPIKRAVYNSTAILAAVTYYNLGHTLEETACEINRRFKVRPSEPTIASWSKRLARTCSFAKLRKRYKIDPERLLVAKPCKNGKSFVRHELKLNIAGKAFPGIKDFIKGADATIEPTAIPVSCAGRKTTRRWRNVATTMAFMALITARTRQERLEEIQRFFLANDASTFAANVPITLSPQESTDLQAPFAGHMDLLQLRNGKIYILDYREGPLEQAAPLLELYRQALSKRAGIPMNAIATASFNQDGYLEFD